MIGLHSNCELHQAADQPDDAVHAPAKTTARKTMKKITVKFVFCWKKKSYWLKSLSKAKYDSLSSLISALLNANLSRRSVPPSGIRSSPNATGPNSFCLMPVAWRATVTWIARLTETDLPGSQTPNGSARMCPIKSKEETPFR